ncbi:unnamed protein product, partial [Polarella glacialis]
MGHDALPPVPWGCLGLCATSYLMVHMSCQVITCSLPELSLDKEFVEAWSTSDVGSVLGWASLAAALGYGLHGPMIDRAGRRWGVLVGLLVALGGAGLGTRLLATSTTKSGFMLGSMLLRFSYAAGWPAEMKAIRLLVPSERQGLAVSTLGFASRGGAILGRCLFGLLSSHFQLSWRQIAMHASAMLLGGGSLIIVALNKIIAKSVAADNEQLEASLRPLKAAGRPPTPGLRRLLSEHSVWLLAASFCCLCHVVHGDDFMPLLFVGLTGSSHGVALSAVFPLGGLVAMLLNASLGQRLPRRRREQLYVRACGLAALALLALLALLTFSSQQPTGVASFLPAGVVAALLFCVGFSAALPYYLVPNLFAFEIAGEHCATLISFCELVSFTSKMPAHMLLLYLADVWGWRAALLQMLGTCLLAGVLLHHLILIWQVLQRTSGPGRASAISALEAARGPPVEARGEHESSKPPASLGIPGLNLASLPRNEQVEEHSKPTGLRMPGLNLATARRGEEIAGYNTQTPTVPDVEKGTHSRLSLALRPGPSEVARGSSWGASSAEDTWLPLRELSASAVAAVRLRSPAGSTTQTAAPSAVFSAAAASSLALAFSAQRRRRSSGAVAATSGHGGLGASAAAFCFCWGGSAASSARLLGTPPRQKTCLAATSVPQAITDQRKREERKRERARWLSGIGVEERLAKKEAEARAQEVAIHSGPSLVVAPIAEEEGDEPDLGDEDASESKSDIDWSNPGVNVLEAQRMLAEEAWDEERWAAASELGDEMYNTGLPRGFTKRRADITAPKAIKDFVELHHLGNVKLRKLPRGEKRPAIFSGSDPAHDGGKDAGDDGTSDVLGRMAVAVHKGFLRQRACAHPGGLKGVRGSFPLAERPE